MADPTTEAAAYATAWQVADYEAAGTLTSEPAAAEQVLEQVGLNLSPSEFTVTPGAVTRTGDDTATVAATVAWTLGDAGTWSYDVQWPWTYANGHWTLSWSSAAVHPQLGPQQSLTVRISKSTDGTVVDRDDAQLLNPTRVYSVIALRDEVTDPAATAAALAPIVSPFRRQHLGRPDRRRDPGHCGRRQLHGDQPARGRLPDGRRRAGRSPGRRGAVGDPRTAADQGLRQDADEPGQRDDERR